MGVPISDRQLGGEHAGTSAHSAVAPHGSRPSLRLVTGAPGEKDAPDHQLAELSNDELASGYQRGEGSAWLDALLMRNENLCHHVLKRFARADEPYEDLFQVARLGLIKACQRFDPSYGTAFATYAVPVIDGEVRHYLRDALLVRQPRWARSLYERIQQFQTEFLREHRRSPSMAEIAEGVNVQEEGVLELIRSYGSMDPHVLDEVGVADGGEAMCGPDSSVFRSLRPENFSLPIEDRIMLYEAMSTLSDVHRKMIYLLFFKDLTQQEVADELGVSQRTVSREQSRALGRLKAILTKKIF